MRLELRNVAKGPHNEALPPTSLRVASGQLVVVAAETAQRPTVLGLIASGRMAPDAGETFIDGKHNRHRLHNVSMLVDAPAANDPAPNVAAQAVLAEELMFVGRPSSPRRAKRLMERMGISEWASTPIADVPTEVRLRILTEVAATRKGLQLAVVVSPDRFGGDPADWMRPIEALVDRGFGVLVICSAITQAYIERMHPPTPAPDITTHGSYRFEKKS